MFIDGNKITHIIFDWDGTLMDSAAKIVSCMQKAAILSDLPVPSVSAVEHIIGVSLVPAIKRLFAVDDQKAEQISAHYKDVFISQDQTACPLFDGAHELLEALSSNYVLGVATGKARRGLLRAFDSSASTHYFDQSICADEAESKPSSDMLNQLLARWNINASQSVMVGDTTYDMQMAQNINMPRIAVSYGVHDKQSLLAHKPFEVIDKLTELHQIFETR
jgi:phosphoglycolate phosphatase